LTLWQKADNTDADNREATQVRMTQHTGLDDVNGSVLSTRQAT